MSDTYRKQVYEVLFEKFESSTVKVEFKLARGSSTAQSYIVPVYSSKSVFNDTVKKINTYLDLRFVADKNDKSLKINSIFKDNNNTIDLVLPFKGNEKKCTVRVYNLNYFETDDLSQTNAGITYQTQLINKMRSAGYTRQVKAEEGESGADLTINVNGIEIRIEIKSPGSAYGSGQLQYRNFESGWTIKSSNKQNPEFEKILKGNDILKKLTSSWYRTGYIPPEKATKQSQQMLGDRKYPIDSSYIRQYYKKVHYLQYKNKGLFLIDKNNNPLNLDVPLLETSKSYFRARVQNSGRGRFKYVGELYAPNLITSTNQVSLDGDLGFLEEINNNKPQV